MRFFEISYIPKGTEAYEIVGEILSDPELVSEVNEQIDERGLFFVNVIAKDAGETKPSKKEIEGGNLPTKRYSTSIHAAKKKLIRTDQSVADFDIEVVSGEKHDAIVINGKKEYEHLGKILLSHIRRKILPKLDPMQNVIVVKSH